MKFDENMMSRNSWAQDLMTAFRDEVQRAKLAVNQPASPVHGPPPDIATAAGAAGKTSLEARYQGSGAVPNEQISLQTSKPQYHANAKPSQGQMKQGQRGQGQPQQRQRAAKLLESCFVIRLEDFVLYRVSTSESKRNSPKKFLTSNKKQLLLPPEMSAVHIEYTEYYFPEGINYPGENYFPPVHPSDTIAPFH